MHTTAVALAGSAETADPLVYHGDRSLLNRGGGAYPMVAGGRGDSVLSSHFPAVCGMCRRYRGIAVPWFSAEQPSCCHASGGGDRIEQPAVSADPLYGYDVRLVSAGDAEQAWCCDPDHGSCVFLDHHQNTVFESSYTDAYFVEHIGLFLRYLLTEQT